LCERGDAILELMYILRATFGSFSAGARGAVGDFDVLYEDMNAAYLDVSSVITSFELSLLDYFANREYDYAKSAAIQSGYDAITGMSGAVTRYSHTLPSFFDVPAAPALVPLGISFPDSVGPSRIFRVDAYLLNTGSGIASDVSVALSFEGPFDFLTADTITVASLAPGDSTHLSWQMRVKPPGHAGLMRGLYSCSMEPYSSDSFSYPRFFFLRTYKKNFGVNFAALKKGPEGDVSLRSVPKIYFLYQNSPNPFNPQTSIAFDIAGDEPQRVNLRIYDLRGRLLVTLVDQMKAPGRYRISWDGRDGDGRLLGTGIYFYVIDAGSFRSVRKMILRK
jgi:hypothetical protein